MCESSIGEHRCRRQENRHESKNCVKGFIKIERVKKWDCRFLGVVDGSRLTVKSLHWISSVQASRQLLQLFLCKQSCSLGLNESVVCQLWESKARFQPILHAISSQSYMQLLLVHNIEGAEIALFFQHSWRRCLGSKKVWSHQNSPISFELDTYTAHLPGHVTETSPKMRQSENYLLLTFYPGLV